jgi:cytochrome c556
MKKLILLILLSIGCIAAQNNYSTKSNWLIETKTDAEKFHAIQKQFRGFDLAMVEVGYRFNRFYFALKDKNYDLAHYQWDKIKKAIENGIQRRPKRKENSQKMFLDTQYKSMKSALDQKDEKHIWQEYEKVKNICNACHVAEKVPFIKVIDPQQRWQPIR